MNRIAKIVAAPLFALAATACGNSEPEPAPTPTATPTPEAPAIVGLSCSTADGNTVTLRRTSGLGDNGDGMSFDNTQALIVLSPKGAVIKNIGGNDRRTYDQALAMAATPGEENFGKLYEMFQSSCAGVVEGNPAPFLDLYGIPTPGIPGG